MTYKPLLRQILVATSPQLGAFSVGGAIGFPNVLLQQLRNNETAFRLDLDTSSWIGSIHGLAGIPSILMPALMQWKGRKLAFLICCLLIMAGWTTVFLAKNITTILISECLLGLGGNSLIIVSLTSLTEMMNPKYRNMFIVIYGSMQALGISSVGILGQYLNWKTVSLIYFLPATLTFLNAFFIWPESPSWLALQNRFQECEKTFKWLRGKGVNAEKELLELLHAREVNKQNAFSFNALFKRDFYIPILLMFVLLNMSYWSGETVVIIYAVEIIKRTSGNDLTASNGMIILDILLFVCHVICVILVRRFNNKTIVLICTLCTIMSLLFCSIVTYLQTAVVLGQSPLCLYGLIAFITFCNLGLTPVVFAVALEIIPVKHRGIGGALYIIVICCLHTSSLKAAPYLFIGIELWGTFLLYAINAIVCVTIMWIFVPETKNKTLQELEDYFNKKAITKPADDPHCQVPMLTHS